MKHRTEGHTEKTISGDTCADWSQAFELVPNLETAYVWHVSAITRDVLDGLLKRVRNSCSTASRTSTSRVALTPSPKRAPSPFSNAHRLDVLADDRSPRETLRHLHRSALRFRSRVRKYSWVVIGFGEGAAATLHGCWRQAAGRQLPTDHSSARELGPCDVAAKSLFTGFSRRISDRIQPTGIILTRSIG
jgi:hypothetical protein